MEQRSLEVFKKHVDMALRTWLNGEHGGGVVLMVELDDLKKLL